MIYNKDVEMLEKKVLKLQKQVSLETRKVYELYDLCRESNLWWVMKEAKKIMDKTK